MFCRKVFVQISDKTWIGFYEKQFPIIQEDRMGDFWVLQNSSTMGVVPTWL